MNGDGFITRITRTSAAVAVFVALFLAALGWTSASLSYAVGACIGLGFLVSTRLAVERWASPKVKRAIWFFIALAVLKYGIAAWVIWWFVSWPRARYGAFVGGAATTQIVMFLKAVGQMLADRSDPVTLPGAWWQPRK